MPPARPHTLALILARRSALGVGDQVIVCSKEAAEGMAARMRRFVQYVILGLVVLTLGTRSAAQSVATPQALPPLPPAVFLPSDAAAVEDSIRFLEHRLQHDPADFIAANQLARLYLQRLREMGDLTYLQLASRAARTSLATLPAEQNTGGLTTLALAEYAAHDFVAARDHAWRLTELEPSKGYPFQILGDALLELGEYDQAQTAFRQMEQLGGIYGLTQVAMEQRIARLAALRGDMRTAQRHLITALTLALALPVPPRETVAWCRWQLGETAFAMGDYATAEQHYRDTLTTLPDYFRALASLARVRAARGDHTGAIAQYETTIRIIPDLTFVAALGDLYKLVGREKDAAAQYLLVEQIGRLSTGNNVLYNRPLVLFYADHDLKPEEAYAGATREYAVRRDIYGADAVAWTALKAGKIGEAQSAIKEALRLGTQDARLLYHAGMIAQTAGDHVSARHYLTRALTLNPEFDPLQASIARTALDRDK
jgi:tetratricopeptide (TPR) repeat protein